MSYLERIKKLRDELAEHKASACFPASTKRILELLDGAVKELEATRWISVKERLPEHDNSVLLVIETDNLYTKEHVRRVIRGCHIDANKMEAWDDYDDRIYNEEDDAFYVNESWFEEIDFWEDYSYAKIDDDWTVTYWRPLPTPPESEACP